MVKYNSNICIASIYRMSAARCADFFEYINSHEKALKRKGNKKYRDIAVGQFIIWVEEQYDFEKQNLLLRGNTSFRMRLSFYFA